MNRIYIFLLISIIALTNSCDLLNSCDSEVKSGKGSQGVIHYNISYINNKLIKFPTYTLPKSMNLKFKNHMSKNTIEGFMGLFSISYITNTKKSTNITILKVMESKYYYVGEKHEIPCSFDDLAGKILTPVNEPKEIAGLKCNKMVVSFTDTKRDTFSVYYTNDISVRHPNRVNPYKEIEGVMMQFDVKLSYVEMRFLANKVKFEPIDDSEFEVPQGYKEIGKEKMVELINKLME